MLTKIKQLFKKFKWKGELKGMNEMDSNYILKLIDEFDKCEEREIMLKAKEYYLNKNDIRYRKKYFFENGEKKVDYDKANNKISHSFLKLLVDEKVNYLLAEPLVFECIKNDDCIEKIKEILGDEFLDTLIDTGTESSNCGIGWIHCFINDDGELEFTMIESEQVLPLWKNQNKRELDGVIRYYYVDYYVGTEKKQKMKIEHWSKEGVTYYVKENGMLLIDDEMMELNGTNHIVTEEGGKSWERVPFIPFKNNSNMTSDLVNVKDIIDEYDKRTSETSNTLDEIQELIYVLKNYGGENLGEFMQNLKHHKAIKVDEDGGVDVVKAEINIDAIEKHLDRLKADFYHFGQGVDMDVDKFGNNPSGVALEFIYGRLKLKTGAMERKFKTSLKELLYFVAKYLEYKEGYTLEPKDVKVTFNKSIITNNNEIIDSCSKSASIISKETILANHPWVDDVEEELEKLEEEQGQAFDIPFNNPNTLENEPLTTGETTVPTGENLINE